MNKTNVPLMSEITFKESDSRCIRVLQLNQDVGYFFLEDDNIWKLKSFLTHMSFGINEFNAIQGKLTELNSKNYSHEGQPL